ncbi:MAG: UDP-N-acetylmuramoyl-L-alanyl-D-glutamate--2,6-diaminopimelate ligase [Burkholderiaceae bacterium]|nr:UDP-N-acetylmuramoyl-L-alanyl-D-glutamate--2,6-diaminopimelate ligase [Burkholderiaceae bacterium]
MHTLTTPLEAAQWLHARVHGALSADSRAVDAGDGFIAWPGAATDGRRFVGAALAQGASACLVEAEGVQAFNFDGFEGPGAVAAYAGLKAATGPIAALYYAQPSRHIDVLAVTGTNGKTSTAWWLAQALGHLGTRCGVIGTLGAGVPPALEYTGLTTPDPVRLQRQLRAFVDQGLGACAIEASSIGLAERRLDGTRIAAAVFTNLTQDHLDYHASMQAYWQAKAELFDWPGLRAAALNVDDRHGRMLALELRERGGLDLWTLSAAGSETDAETNAGVDGDAGIRARLCARDVCYDAHGLRFVVAETGAAPQVLATRLIGQYNVPNLLGVIATLRALGHPLEQAVAACRALDPVPGRMECIAVPSTRPGPPMPLPLVVVDYAHTPDALAQALAGLRPLVRERGGQLWCVFGCGGERDRGKRPLMAAAAGKWADRLVLTSDNPRSEPPEAILAQMLRGLAAPQTGAQAVQVEPDRARAIVQAIAQAAAQDVVLLAGRGHESHQEIAGERIPFRDHDHAAAALAARTTREPVGSLSA